MSEFHCEKEQVVTAAFRNAQSDAEILSHAYACPICSEILLVGGFLQHEKQLAEHELGSLPDVGLIWRKAEIIAREEALAKATWPIRLARLCASVAAVLMAAWLVLQLLPQISLWFKTSPAISEIASATFNHTILMGIVGSLVCIGLSSWYMLREE